MKKRKSSTKAKIRGTEERRLEAYQVYDDSQRDEGNKEGQHFRDFIAGVDEAGRGPLAGPVAIGVVVVPHDFDWRLIPGVGDSKQVKERDREKVVRVARALKRAGVIDFHVALVSHTVIDRINISRAVFKGIDVCFKKLAPNPDVTLVKLDGLLKAPKEFLNQETIIKGDAKEKVIGLASILAKVTRDHHMVAIAKKYPQYHFDIHKGYGTQKHRDAITKYGLTKIHRRSFCKKFL